MEGPASEPRQPDSQALERSPAPSGPRAHLGGRSPPSGAPPWHRTRPGPGADPRHCSRQQCWPRGSGGTWRWEEVRAEGSEPRPHCRCCPPSPASPGDVQVTTGGGHMQGRPALVVCLVHRGALLNQEVHHLQVLINAGLGGGSGCQRPPHPHTTHPPRWGS